MATLIKGKQIKTTDFIRGESSVDWNDDTTTASQKAIAQLVSDNSDKHHVYEWRTYETSIVISHNLGKQPAVTVVDTALTEIICEVRYIDNDRVELRFSAPVRGTAYFN